LPVGEGEILFQEDFCGEALNNFDAFLEKLDDQIKTKLGLNPDVLK
jgi:hypothetical protein